MRAERRVGELMQAQKETIGLANGGDAVRARVSNGPEVRPFLAEAGIDKHLADRARKLTRAEEAEFERRVGGPITTRVLDLPTVAEISPGGEGGKSSGPALARTAGRPHVESRDFKKRGFRAIGAVVRGSKRDFQTFKLGGLAGW